MRISMLFLIMMVSASFLWAQNPQYEPRNEVATDPSLQLFVQNLLQAIEQENEAFLISALDENVVSEFEGAGGIARFKEIWKLDQGPSMVWPHLKRLIDLGGVFLHDDADETGRYQFVFPYVYAMDLDLGDDYFSIGLVTGKNVNLRERPDTKAPAKTQLSYDVIWFLSGDEYGQTEVGTNQMGNPEWYMIQTYDRKHKGWINWRFVHSPVGYRLFLFKNANGSWKISAFLIGD